LTADRKRAIQAVEELSGAYRVEQKRLLELSYTTEEYQERTDLENRAAACWATVERLELVRRELLPRRRTRRPAGS